MQIVDNPDGSRDIVHPTGVTEHQAMEYVLRFAAKTQAIRQGLIDHATCGYHCPAGKAFYCCQNCGKDGGYYQANEVDQFSQDDQQLIVGVWNAIDGYLGLEGCRIPRRLMPIACLKYVCIDKE